MSSEEGLAPSLKKMDDAVAILERGRRAFCEQFGISKKRPGEKDEPKTNQNASSGKSNGGFSEEISGILSRFNTSPSTATSNGNGSNSSKEAKKEREREYNEGKRLLQELNEERVLTLRGRMRPGNRIDESELFEYLTFATAGIYAFSCMEKPDLLMPDIDEDSACPDFLYFAEGEPARRKKRATFEKTGGLTMIVNTISAIRAAHLYVALRNQADLKGVATACGDALSTKLKEQAVILGSMYHGGLPLQLPVSWVVDIDDNRMSFLRKLGKEAFESNPEINPSIVDFSGCSAAEIKDEKELMGEFSVLKKRALLEELNENDPQKIAGILLAKSCLSMLGNNNEQRENNGVGGQGLSSLLERLRS